MNRRIKIIFTISLMLNVLLLGIVAGGIYKRIAESPFHGKSRPLLNHKMAKTVMQIKREHGDLHKEMRQARDDLIKALSADDFNEEDFLVASQKMEIAQSALFDARTKATIKIAKDLPPEDRKELAKRLRLMPFRHDRREPEGEPKKSPF